ncbi:MAG TPA: hypothetical protein VE685_20845 [Thermoanaerobaculia bacterium]|nr:hypothetical protein [Thermoanaerobaculia bacterium]
MPELTPQSTPPEVAAIPPIVDPAAFEDFPVLRECYLLYVTDLEANDALRDVAELLYNMTLEYWNYWPDHPEGLIRAQLRAAVADVRFLQGFLAMMERDEAAMSTPHEEHLCRVAGDASQDLAAIADRVEKELGTWRG